MAEGKLPRPVYNRLSIIGAIIAIAAVAIMTFLYVIDLFASSTNPYFGIFLYMVIPAFLIFGLLLIPAGIYLKWRHWKKTGEVVVPRWPLIDLNDKKQRNAATIFVVGTVLFMVLTAIGSYQAFHYSESVTFCGKLCHTVMKPEYTAYLNSPHARVPCVDCHVGPGADWYAKSKLSGAYQVYAVLANKYPRPIPTPVANLRPAQETCEQCHWPQKFFGSQQTIKDHYKYDKENTHWPIDMLIKVGGSNIRSGKAIDIHWHINPDIDVQYIARDDKRQEIPWVKVKNLKTGEETLYHNEDDPLTEEEIAAATPRVMDCVDCHNRPSHIYHSPDQAVDEAISAGLIDASLPDIKSTSVEAMTGKYNDDNDAMTGIAEAIKSHYAENYPGVADSMATQIQDAIKAVQMEYSNNMFPEMKVEWSEYPNNIGHFIWPGCMRCHEGSHKTEDGKMISHDCKSCHTIMAQGSGDMAQAAIGEEGLEFKHPEDIDEAWKEMGCFECHTGTQP